MKASDTPSAHPQAVLREEFDDYAVLFQPLFGEAFGLDPVGVVVWKLLAQRGQRTLSQIAAEVAAQCGESPDTVLEDILAFAQDLHRRLFITVGAEEAGWETTTQRDQDLRPARSTPVISHAESGLALADGTRLILRAGDTRAARVVSFLAEAAQLPPVSSFPLPGARCLLAVTGVERDNAGPHSRPRYVSPVSAEADADIVCVLEPPGATRPRRRAIGEGYPVPRRGDDPLFSLEPLTEEQWLWQQLVRLSAAVGRETHPRGGVLLHSGLAQAPHLRCGAGFLLAGRSGVGKSTASARLPLPWRSLADDVTLVVCDDDGTYQAHPWPTWSRLIGEESWEEGYSWDVQQAVPLRAIFFLEQGDEDRVEPLGPGHALCALAELAQQTSRYLLQGMPLDEIVAFHQQRFDNLCALVQAMPAYLLHVTLHGAFWHEIEKVL